MCELVCGWMGAMDLCVCVYIGVCEGKREEKEQRIESDEQKCARFALFRSNSTNKGKEEEEKITDRAVTYRS